MDCLEAMRQMPDAAFDLAIVDPPYGDAGGGGAAKNALENGSTNIVGGGGSHFQRKNVRKPDGTWGYANWRNVGDEVRKKIIAWDVAPEKEYFDQLFRVSRYQIIWGGNYFDLPPSRNFIIWKKLTISETFSMAMAEYAWTNIPGNAKVFEYAPQGKGDRFHPTQKPVELYKWLLKMYAKPGWSILDTHLGSGSSRIAAWDLGFDFTGYEIDRYYFDKMEERFEKHKSQISLFEDSTPLKAEQEELT